MKKILSVLFVASMYLVQCAFARPSAYNDDLLKAQDVCHQRHNFNALAPKANDGTFVPSTQLMKMTLFALLNMSLTYSSKAQAASESMLKESSLQDNHSSEVKEFFKNIQEFQEKYSTCHDIFELFKITEFYSTFTSDFFEKEKKGTLTPDSKLILEALKKFHTQEIEDEFEKNFNEFFTIFSKKINEFKVQLKEEKEKNLGEKILRWWSETETLKEYEDKIEAFAEFVKFYHEH